MDRRQLSRRVHSVHRWSFGVAEAQAGHLHYNADEPKLVVQASGLHGCNFVRRFALP